VSSRHGAPDLNWLITSFANRVAGIAHAVVVSADGLPLAFSDALPQDRADQLAAIASGLVSLTQGAAQCFQAGEVSQTVVEMETGFLLVMSMTEGCSLAVLSSRRCDLGQVGYEMALLAERVGVALSPQLRSGATPSYAR
jgi:predicted regulator of Ras-like GTPase activity (Roadblock/LC7/MglB family)